MLRFWGFVAFFVKSKYFSVQCSDKFLNFSSKYDLRKIVTDLISRKNGKISKYSFCLVLVVVTNQSSTKTVFDNVSNNKRWAFFKLQPNIFHLVPLDTVSTCALSEKMRKCTVGKFQKFTPTIFSQKLCEINL